jgi:hypothetical protein
MVYKKSKDVMVQKFLEEVLSYSEEYSKTVQKLRSIVFIEHPKVTERMMYGGIMITLKDDFGGVFVSKQHISFEFSNGLKLKDPQKVLAGSGKFRRHLNIKSFQDIKDKDVKFFVKQIV